MQITPQTPITVIGVSQNPTKYGHKIFKDLLDAKYNVTGVNPRGEKILGQRIFTELFYVKPKPELVISVVPPEITMHVIEQCMELEIDKIWMQPGSESDEAIEFAKEIDMEVVANACIMVDRGIW